MFAAGEGHEQKMINAMELSRDYFKNIGAKVADKKCFVSSTCQNTRKRLRKHKWKEAGVRIAVVNHFRDLGGHVCMDQTHAATTNNKRLDEATEMVYRLNRLPIDVEIKRKIIRMNALPSGLYACEISRCGKSNLEV